MSQKICFFRPETAIIKLVKKPAFFSYLPSKKFIITAVSVLIAGLGIFWALSQKGFEKSREIFPENLSVKSIFSKAEQKDSDSDGLLDWEEALWNTDINNPDTDRDSSSDKQEADNGYDPLDPLSNEKTGKKGEPREFIIPDISDSINFTKEMAKISGFQVFQAGTEGSQLDISDSLNFLDEDANKELAGYIAGFNPRVSERELKISSDNSREAVGKYIQEFIRAQLPIPHDDSGQTLGDILNEAAQTKDFKKLDEFINYFERTIGNLKNLVIPSDFLSVHKKKIELLMSTKRICESVKEIDKDPLKTIFGLQQYGKIEKESEDFLTGFSNLIQKYFK